jgi:hypothetical protein
VKLFRWLDNKEDSASYRKNVELLVPAIMSVLPLRYRDRVVKNDSFAHRMARLEKEVSEAKQALMLDAPKKEKLKELGEGIFEMFRVDPDLTAPLLAMVTTMLGDVKTSEKAKAGLREQNRLSGAKTECNCGAKYVKHS